MVDGLNQPFLSIEQLNLKLGRYCISTMSCIICLYIQWNLSYPDIYCNNEADESVLNSEVSSFEGLISIQIWHSGKCPVSEVSLILLEWFHCIIHLRMCMYMIDVM